MSYLSDWIQVQLAAGRISRDVADRLDDFYAKVRPFILDDESISTRELRSLLDADLIAVLEENLFTVGQAAIVSSATYLGTEPIAMTKTLVRQAFNTPLEANNNQTIKSTYDNLLRGIIGRAEGLILRVKQGSLSVRASRNEILENKAIDRRYVESFTRTAINSVSNIARNSYFLKIDEVDRVVWLATLDHRTSSYCKVMDKTVFAKNEGPRPPAHVNCRSVALPLKKGEDAEKTVRALEQPRVVPTEDYDKGDNVRVLKTVKTDSGAPATRVRKPSRREGSPLEGERGQGMPYEKYLRLVSKQKNGRQFVRDTLGKEAGNEFLKGASLPQVLRGQAGADEAFEAIKQYARI